MKLGRKFSSTLGQWLRTAMLILGPLVVVFAQDDPIQSDRIVELIREATSGDRNRVAALLAYPYERTYPLEPIGSVRECLRKYDEIFDQALISELRGCDPRKDWNRVGWRGVMFKNGTIWLTDDYKILAIHHETSEGRKALVGAIAANKRKLPPSLRDFDRPILEWKTRNRLIRIDQKGEDYRLVVRRRESPFTQLKVLHGGKFNFDGQLGAYFVDWQSQGRTYRVYSGVEPSEDRYCIFPGTVAPGEWPDHPQLEDSRRD